MKPREIRRHDQHPLARAEAFQRLEQACPQIVHRQFGIGGATFKIQHNFQPKLPTVIGVGNAARESEIPVDLDKKINLRINHGG